jgi:hypothetical protein
MNNNIITAKYITLARTIWHDSIAKKEMQSPKIMKDKTK